MRARSIQKPPFQESQMTGHFTSYKPRPNHELATMRGPMLAPPARWSHIGATKKGVLRMDFDLFVIGGGSAGVRCARISAGHGARVGGAGERFWGGTRVNIGGVP